MSYIYICTEYICTLYTLYIYHNQSCDSVYITYTCTVIDYHTLPKTTNDSDQEILGARKLLANVDQIQDVLR